MDFTQIADEVAAQEPVQTVSIPVVPGRVVDIDGDVLAYEHGANKDQTAEAAWTSLVDRVRFIQAMAGAESHMVHLTCRGSTKGQRVLVANTQPYQDHRKGGSKPLHWETLRLRLENYRKGGELNVFTWTDREADDGLALAATVGKGRRVIATCDKDLRMVPGLHLAWNTLEVIEVTEDYDQPLYEGKVYGPKWFYLQLLQGDKADHIPGVGPIPGKASRGVGDKTALKLLADATTEVEAARLVLALYLEAHGERAGYERLVEQAALLWMRRTPRAPLWEFLRYWPDESVHEHMAVAIGYHQLRIQKLEAEAQAIMEGTHGED